MREPEESGSHDKTANAAQKLLDLIGKKVTIPDGPMAGVLASVKRASERGADMEVEAFGKRAKLRLALEDVACACQVICGTPAMTESL